MFGKENACLYIFDQIHFLHFFYLDFLLVLCHSIGILKKQQADPINFENLSGYKLVKTFKSLMQKKLDARSPEQIHSSELDPKRKLFASDFFSLLLFALYNPILKSLRAVSYASDYGKVLDFLDTSHVSLGSFSEAQHVFDPELLREVFIELSRKIPFKPSAKDQRLEVFIEKMIAVDGSFFDALPRMTWAVYRTQSDNRKVKLHLLFEALNGGIADAEITPGNQCERKALKKLIQKNRLYVGDRYYGLDYNYFRCFIEAEADFLMRIKGNCQYEIIEEFDINEKSKNYGVRKDLKVRLNGTESKDVYRLIIIERDGKEFLLLTNRFDIEADLVGILYRNRWEVEQFFKWLKCIIQCEHFLLESPAGVSSQIYAALVLALLLSAFNGNRPNKRQMEAIQLHLMGLISFEELQSVLLAEKKEK